MLDGAVLLVWDGNVAYSFGNTHSDVFLEEALSCSSLRAANDAEWPVCNVRQHAFRNGDEIVGEIELGRARFAIENLIGVGDGQIGLAGSGLGAGFRALGVWHDAGLTSGWFG